jgi:hypothetical protein
MKCVKSLVAVGTNVAVFPGVTIGEAGGRWGIEGAGMVTILLGFVDLVAMLSEI